MIPRTQLATWAQKALSSSGFGTKGFLQLCLASIPNISWGNSAGNGAFRTFEVCTSLRESCMMYGSTPSVMFSDARYRNRSLSTFWGAACQATRQDLVAIWLVT